MPGLLRAGALHLEEQLNQPSVARIGAGAVAGFEVTDEAAMLATRFRTEKHGEVRLLSGLREDVSKPLRQQRNGSPAPVLENEEIGVGKAVDRLESQDAHARVEDEILPGLPRFVAGTACLEGVMPPFLFLGYGRHGFILQTLRAATTGNFRGSRRHLYDRRAANTTGDNRGVDSRRPGVQSFPV